jgi:light-regulated signal transduction histidine kinase (bacteriophytochrome)
MRSAAGSPEEKLDDMRRDMEALAYSISHDLRAPLRHIRGYADLLKDALGDKLEGKEAGYLKVIVSATQNLETGIEDILAYSRIGRADLKPEAVDMARLARECIAELKPIWGSRNVAWEVGDLPEVEADRTQVRQALLQFLGNAVKFTKDRAEAKIAIGWQADAEGWGRFHVRDNGVGFNPAYAGKLFRLFQRLHRSSDFEGRGVGLALAHALIRRQGGKLWAEAEADKGATFYFSLPLHPAGD